MAPPKAALQPGRDWPRICSVAGGFFSLASILWAYTLQQLLALICLGISRGV